MNKLLIGSNIFLILALGYLYYFNFSKNSGKSTVAKTENLKASDSLKTNLGIAYVELDSLNEKLIFLKQQREILEMQQKQMEAEITDDAKALDAKQTNFVQKNPNATPEEIQNIRQQLQKGQENLESKRQSMSQEMNQKRFKLMDKVQKNLKLFLTEYNKDGRYKYILTTGSGLDYLIYKDSTLDITKDVIKGLNDKFKAEVK